MNLEIGQFRSGLPRRECAGEKDCVESLTNPFVSIMMNHSGAGGISILSNRMGLVKYKPVIYRVMGLLLVQIIVALKCIYESMIIAAIIVLFEVPSYSEEFQAEGVVNIKHMDERGNVTQQQSETFKVDVKGCQWFIVTTPYPLAAKADIIGWEIGSKGDNEICQVAKFNQQTLRADSFNNSVGFVERGVVPDNVAGNQVSELWLAFASGCYFDGLTNNMMKPVYDEMDPSMRGRYEVVKSRWQRFESSPKLPQRVVYTNNQIEGFYKGKTVKRPAPHPFENGYDRAEYESSSTTNVGGLVLPRKFSFKEYAVIQTAKADSHLVLYRVVEGYLTAAEPVCERTVFLPSLTDASYVDDARFARLPHPVISLSYMVTNRVWPQFDSPVLQNLYAEEARRQEAYTTNHVDTLLDGTGPGSKSKRLMVLLFLILSIFPLGYFIKRTWKAGGKT
ncbi:MAG: hypothetical protein P4N60_06810 [Verrucomicrobiae bacterium]|nr:hypothetical protein [Verrucomicrobiae bacterium]